MPAGIPGKAVVNTGRRALQCVVVVVIAACSPTSVEDSDEYVHEHVGTCVPSEPESASVGDVEISLEVEPAVVTYGEQFWKRLLIRNLGDDLFEVDSECRGRSWVRGEDPLYENTCAFFGVYLPAGEEFVRGSAGEFRSSGPQYATVELPGVRADPDTYCYGVEFEIGEQTIRLETPFDLVEG